ncbi:putative high-affinity nickel-transport protein [Gordonia effusa NBRC 100432]|uniref:Nickel/cobalt efflux system n=1 Tax=Gordonia effusa NBRC 100432 TaxID=1077974 RepID=H0R450_9ACTN|nr:nickel transporter [Gordonia effusa]GAB19851.1 putative high-affinity nickel-transport protein [Gordonia effusa NBRC 100432]
MFAEVRAKATGLDRGSVIAVITITLLHLIGWGGLLLLVVPSGVNLGDTAGGLATLGVGLTAYALGMRHAFDADHIAAIDNTTRRFVDRGRPTSAIGFWFSLGHSTIVFALCVVLTVGISAAGSALRDDGSSWMVATGMWGPTVSGVFLLVIAAVNVRSLVVRRRADSDSAAAASGGMMWRLLGSFDRVVDRPWRMYVVGLLFGFGFDTATEIGLLALAGAASLSHVPWWAVLTLPVLFAAGMSLLDTTQGAVMRRAYAWSPDGPDALRRRSRAQTYSIAMTGLSVVVAVVIGGVELAEVATTAFGWGGPVAWLGALDIDDLGLWLTGLLLATWAVVFVKTRRESPSAV